MKHAPIALFVYNRPIHTQSTLDALASNYLANESELFIFSDGSKEDEANISLVVQVRKIIEAEQRFAAVHLHYNQNNKGLADSILSGVTFLLTKFSKIIVLEDDLITNKTFLKYMNQGLNLYSKVDKVMSVSGHSFTSSKISQKNGSYFLPYMSSWGWGTWDSSWRKFDKHADQYTILKTNKKLRKKFNLSGSYNYSELLYDQMETNKVDSWAIRWWWTIFMEQGVSLFPDRSLVRNIGFDDSGTHTLGLDITQNGPKEDYEIINFPEKIKVRKSTFSEVKKIIKSEFHQKIKGYSFFQKSIDKVKFELKRYL